MKYRSKYKRYLQNIPRYYRPELMVGYKPPGHERWLNEKYRIKSLLPPVDRWRRGKQCDTVSWQAIWLVKVTTVISQMQVPTTISFKFFKI